MPDGKERAKRVLAALKGKISEGASTVSRRVEAWEAERKEEREWLEGVRKDEIKKQKALTERHKVRVRAEAERRRMSEPYRPRRRSESKRSESPFGSLSFFGEEPRRKRR